MGKPRGGKVQAAAGSESHNTQRPKKRGHPKPKAKSILEIRQLLADRQAAHEHTSKFNEELKEIRTLLQDEKTYSIGIGMYRAAVATRKNVREVRQLELLLQRTELEESAASQERAAFQAKAETLLQAARDFHGTQQGNGPTITPAEVKTAVEKFIQSGKFSNSQKTLNIQMPDEVNFTLANPWFEENEMDTA